MPGKHLHYYWITFPQGIYHYRTQKDLNDDNWYMSESIMQCDSKQKALQLCEKYQGAYFEKMIIKNGKRYAKWLYTTRSEDNRLSLDQLYDKYCLNTKIQIVD